MSKISLSYLARDYEPLVEELKKVIPNLTDDWTDFSDGDVGMLILKLMAAVKDMQAYQFDMQQLENYLNTVKQRSNLISIIKPYGYVLRSYRASKVRVHIPNDAYPEGVTPATSADWANMIGTEFFVADESSALLFTFLNKPGDIIPVSDGVDLILWQGQLSEWPKSIEGTSTDLLGDCIDTNGKRVTEVDAIAISDVDAKIAIDGSSYLVINDVINTEFKEVTSFVDSIADYANVYDDPNVPKLYRLFVDRDNKTYLQFFTREVQVNGIDLLSTQTYIKFLLTEGADGLISTGTVLAFKHEGENIPCEVTVIEDMGSNPETIDEAREDIPQYVKTMDRAVSISDYEYIVKQYLESNSPTSGAKFYGVSVVDYYKNITSEDTWTQIPDFVTENYKVVVYWYTCLGSPITSDKTSPNAYVYPAQFNGIQYQAQTSSLNENLVDYLATKRMVGIRPSSNSVAIAGEQAAHPCYVQFKRVRFFIKYRTRTAVNIPAIKEALSEAFKLSNNSFGISITLSEVLNVIYSVDPNIIIDVANGGLKMAVYDDAAHGDNRNAPTTDSGATTDTITSDYSTAVVYGGAIFEIVS